MVTNMIHTTTAITARQNLGELLSGVQYRHDTVLITKAGKPVAALVDIDLFEKIRRMKETFEQLSQELSDAYKNVDISVAQSEIDEAWHSIRKEDE